MGTGSGRRRDVVFIALLLVLIAMWACAAVAGGAEPSAAPVDLLEQGDPRSEGSGAGLVGSPFLILLGVVGLGVVTALVTAVLARLMRRP